MRGCRRILAPHWQGRGRRPRQNMITPSPQIAYPRLLRRLQAVSIDSIVVPIAAIGMLVVTSAFTTIPWIKVSAAALAILVLEPGLVAFTGGTIGHHMIGLKVQDSVRESNIGLVRATLRFLIKVLLGLPSLIFVLMTRRHQALHDWVTGSVVLLRNPTQVPTYEALSERKDEKGGYLYPSRVRRVLIILAYNIGLLAVLGLSSGVLLSEDCVERGVCSSTDNLYDMVLIICWVILLALVLVLGWRGQLWGGRRTRIRS